MEATDARVTAELQEAGYEVRSYSGLLLWEPSEIRLDMGSGRWVGHFGTLSPFLKCGPCIYLPLYYVLNQSPGVAHHIKPIRGPGESAWTKAVMVDRSLSDTLSPLVEHVPGTVPSSVLALSLVFHAFCLDMGTI